MRQEALVVSNGWGWVAEFSGGWMAMESRMPWWAELVDKAGIRLLNALRRCRLVPERTYIRLDTRLALWAFRHEEWLVNGRWRRPVHVEGWLWRLE